MPGVEWLLLYLVLGTLTGFLAGLLGLGGGGILVPLLVTIFAWQGFGTDNVVHLALGTTLVACMMIASLASLRAHALRGAVEWRFVRGMAPGIMLGAFVVAQLVGNVNSAYIALFFSLFMALMAVQHFLDWQPRPNPRPTTLPGLAAVGVVIGAVFTIAAVGGGFLTFIYLGYKNVDLKKAIGTSAAMALPISISGAIGYMVSGWSRTVSTPYTLGYVYVPAFVAIAIAIAVAAPYGARYSHSLPDAQLKKWFAVVSLVLSIKMFVSFLQF